jgi:DNA-binding FadR family transcriptional regulator
MHLTPIARKSLSDSLYEQLRDAIVDGEIPPGTALPGERTLSEQAGVNRQAVREATQRLRRAGLVTIVHGGGAFATDWRRAADVAMLPELLVDHRGNVRAEPTMHLLRMRFALGQDMASLAARRWTPAAEAEMTAAMAHLRRLHDPIEADTLEGMLGFEAVWTVIARATGNLAYRMAQATFTTATTHLAVLFPPRRTPDDAMFAAYERLVAAIAAGDAVAAAAVAREVLLQSGAGMGTIGGDHPATSS